MYSMIFISKTHLKMYFCTFQVLNCNELFYLCSLICTNCFVYTSGKWSLKSCLNLKGLRASMTVVVEVITNRFTWCIRTKMRRARFVLFKEIQAECRLDLWSSERVEVSLSLNLCFFFCGRFSCSHRVKSRRAPSSGHTADLHQCSSAPKQRVRGSYMKHLSSANIISLLRLFKCAVFRGPHLQKSPQRWPVLPQGKG